MRSWGRSAPCSPEFGQENQPNKGLIGKAVEPTPVSEQLEAWADSPLSKALIDSLATLALVQCRLLSWHEGLNNDH